MTKFVSGVSVTALLAGCSARQGSPDGRVLLEKNVFMEPTGKYSGVPPQFSPLQCECLGVLSVYRGQFEPIIYLSGSLPRGGGTTVSLNPGETLKVYRGTNQVAAKNLLIGEFNVTNFPGTDPRPVNMEVDFELTAESNVLISARVDGQSFKYLKLDRVDIAQR